MDEPEEEAVDRDGRCVMISALMELARLSAGLIAIVLLR